MEIKNRRYELVKRITVYILFIIVAIYGLIKAQSFLAPIFLATLLSYLFFPIANFLEKHKVPRIAANLISIFLGIGILVGIIHFFIQQFAGFSENFPEMKEQATKNLSSIEKWISSTFGLSENKVRNYVSESFNNMADSVGIFATAFKVTTNMIVNVGLMPVFIFFMLYYRNKFHEFIIRLAPDNEQERTEDILNKVNKVAMKYMTGVFTVVLILSVLNSVGLSIIGLKFPILLGVTAALFNFIPYFGTLIGALIPLFFLFKQILYFIPAKRILFGSSVAQQIRNRF